MNRFILIFTLVILSLCSKTYAGGFIIVMPDRHANPDAPLRQGMPNPALFPLEVRSNKVEVDINDFSAVTTIEQVFYNPGNRQLEGYFLFPVPKDAIIKHFSMLVNGVETEAELLDAGKARKIYEDIVRRSKDPALLEYYNQGMFRVRIFPILPRSEQRIKLTYAESLQVEDGTIEYFFPLNTDKFSAKPLNQISFKVNVNTKEKLKNVFCPTHEVEINRKGEREAVVGYEATNMRADRDFKLYYSTATSKIGMTMLNYKNADEEGYFYMSISPGIDKQVEVSKKSITFVLDASGSMAGDKMEQAKKALIFCIENLNEEDEFNVVRFSTEATTLFDQTQKANETNRKKAREYVKSIKALGGTNIDEALDMALKNKANANETSFVVFMTDGKPTIGETIEAELLAKVEKYNAEKTRIFTFGIGSDLNTHLLDKLTEMTNAYRTYVTEEEDIEIKVSNFYEKVSSPILTDIKLTFDKDVIVSEIYPKYLPDLFKGSSVTVMGRYSGHGPSKVFLEGQVNGKNERQVYPITFEKKNETNEYIPPLWASRCVGHLLDKIRLHGSNKELVDEVVRLAKKHGIVTPYTSFLIIEDERQLVNRRAIQPRDQLLNNRLAPPAPGNIPIIEEALEEEFESMSDIAGEKSVRSSKEVQTLNKANNIAQTQVGNTRLEFKDKNGLSQNLAGGIQNVQGRAFYNNNNVWIDSNVQVVKNQNTNRIRFNSSDYFALMQKNPETVEILSLGQEVRFVLNNQVYEIYL